ncbi:VIT domain-containing protein [Capnocytophaga cynodegmi]|uniref:VIT domain-containing protein n=1 Tax=Capnocytophaga cynodegmi TaxID=28189 RepID=UPI00385B4F02
MQNNRLLLGICIFITVISSHAQSVLPKMKITNQQNANPMELQELHTDIYVVGQTAITTMEMVFYNPNDRVMEGEFEFPLGAGQVVSRFALDINGKLREGVVVDKKQGRVAFENIVRRGVDPGLLEKTEGNNFKARVYPIPVKASRRILIAFEQELSHRNGKDFYFLPIKGDFTLKKFSLKAEIVSREVKTEDDSVELSFKNWRNSYISELTKTDYRLNKNISLVFPKIEKQQIFASTENEKTYFYGSILTEKGIINNKSFPKKIGLLWDISASSEERDFDKEYQLLEAYFKTIKNVDVELITFNIRANVPKKFSIKNGDWSALNSYLKKQTYDGATYINPLEIKDSSDEYLVFTDGIFNFGEEKKLKLLTATIQKPVYAINSKSVANTDKMQYVSNHTGGNFINLAQQTVQNSLEKLLKPTFRLIEAKVKSGKVLEVYPKVGSPITENYFSFAGQLQSDKAELEFSFGYGNKITESKIVTIRKNMDSSEKEFKQLERFWAGKKIAQMRSEAENQDKIDAVGKEFGIVTEGTSLIVLELLSDYVANRIVPPTELQKEYFEAIAREDKYAKEEENRKKSHKKDKIEKVIAMSKAQSEWWNTSFPINVKKKDGKGEIPPPPLPASAIEEVVVISAAHSDRREVAVEEIAIMEEAEVASEMKEMVAMTGAVSKKMTEKTNVNQTKNIGIQLNTWNPDTPYQKVLEYTDEGKAYETYLKLKQEYGKTPAFYVDAADYFFKKGKSETATLILSNLAELNLEEAQILRVLGYKLLEYKNPKLAILIFQKVLKMREEEPQSFRDLGLALAQDKQYNKAVETLYKVVTEVWNSRFYGIELIAMNEINNIVNTQKNVKTSFIDKRLLKNEPVDVRVVLTWDTDSSDMDLWVTDPKKEKCYYSNDLTKYGGKISNDFTGGYGPEEFMIRKAIDGQYEIQVQYYGNYSQKQLFPVSLRLEFFTNYGSENQKKQEVVIRLTNNKEVIDVGKFIYKK